MLDPIEEWMKCIRNGCLFESTIILNRQLRSRFPSSYNAHEIMSNIGNNVHAAEYTEWIMHDLYKNCNSIGLGDLVSICGLILERAKSYEESYHSPFEALLVAEAALSIANTSSENVKSITDIRESCYNLLASLHLLSEIRVKWRRNITLSLYQNIGLEGLLEEYLDEADSENIEYRVLSLIRPVIECTSRAYSHVLTGHTSGLHHIDLDVILQKWIENKVASTIFLESEDEDNQPNMFAKLVYTAGVVMNHTIRARLILLLMQLPTAAAHGTIKQNTSLLSAEAPSLPNNSSGQHSSVKASAVLARFAKETCQVVDGNLQDALTESLRLLELKSIAYKYGVIKFDSRNQNQVRTVVNRIISQIGLSGAVEDALLFAQSWSSTISPSTVLLKALLYRATDSKSDIISRENNLTSIMNHVLKSKQKACIVEDVIRCLLSGASDVFLLDGSKQRGKIINDRARIEIEVVFQSAVYITSAVIDAQQTLENTDKTLSSDVTSSFVNVLLLTKLKALVALQSEYQIYLTTENLESSTVSKDVVSSLASKIAVEIVESNKEQLDCVFTSPLTPSIRRVCALLNVSTAFFLHTLMKGVISNDTHKISSQAILLYITELIGVEISSSPTLAAEDSFIIADATRLICSAGAKLGSSVVADSQTVFSAFSVSQKVLRGFLEFCAPSMLAQSLDLFSAADLVLAISRRLDSADPAPSDTFTISESNYTKDGILLRLQDVLVPVLRYAMREMERRSNRGKVVAAAAHDTRTGDRDYKHIEDDDDDLVSLIDVMQQSDSHVLATRIVLTTWASASSKPGMLRNSLLPLSRKILSYRDIDTLLAVSCLSCVSYDQVLRELKAIIPSVQSDYRRLKCVAVVGEELSRMWGKEDMLVIFETFQANSRWLHQLQLLRIKVDIKLFQNTDIQKKDAYIRSLVRELLVNSGMDLELTLEYCRQYNIESDFASLCYIEQCLMSPPSGRMDTADKANLHHIAARADEVSVLQLLRRLLQKIHPLDYEKIGFVCSWLVDLLTEDTIHIQLASANAGVTANSTEIETYMRYTDVLGIIHNVHLSPSSDIIAAHNSIYTNLNNSLYLDRIPLWPLLEDPLLMLENAIRGQPELSLKLTPLCTVLHLDQDDFLLRKFKSIYKIFRKSDEALAAKSTNNFKVLLAFSWEELKSVRDKHIKVSAMRWIFDIEKRDYPAWANFVLSKAISLIDDTMTDEDTELLEMRDELITELVKFKCLESLQKLNKWHAADEFSAYIEDPVVLIQNILEKSRECSWELQLGSMSQQPMCTRSLHDVRLSLIVKEYLCVIGEVTEDIHQHHLLLLSSSENENEPQQRSASALETLRRAHLLDIVLKRGLGDVAERKDASVAAADWGTLAAESDLSAGAAECRRRVDMYYSFVTAALIECCPSVDYREKYLKQLMDVVHDSSAKLSSRSKYRAAQALQFLGLVKDDDDAPHNITQLRGFHFCMAEVQEIRLLCNQDNLLAAIGGKYDVKPLVSTWLHDEGFQEDVTEICRDVLLVCHVVDETIWIKLITHMFKNNQYKAAWHTLCMIREEDICPRVCLHPLIRVESLRLLLAMLSEALERLDQSMEDQADTPDPVIPTSANIASRSIILPYKGAKKLRDSLVSIEDQAMTIERISCVWAAIHSAPYTASKEELSVYISIQDLWRKSAATSLSYLQSAEDKSSTVFYLCSHVKNCVVAMLDVPLAKAGRSEVDDTSMSTFVQSLFVFCKGLLKKNIHGDTSLLLNIMRKVCLVFDETSVLTSFSFLSKQEDGPPLLMWLYRQVMSHWREDSSTAQIANILFKWLSSSDENILLAKEWISHLPDEERDVILPLLLQYAQRLMHARKGELHQYFLSLLIE